MSALDTILVDVLQKRMQAGDAVTIHFHDDDEGHNWLLKSVWCLTDKISGVVQALIRFEYAFPGGDGIFEIPTTQVEDRIELLQICRGIFQVNIDARSCTH